MSNKHFIKHLNIETFVHCLLVAFALASIGTISEFLLSNHHNGLTSYGLAIALGGGLVAASVMLAGTNMADREAFFGMLAGVVVVGVMSSTVQTLAYHAHGNTWLVATVLGVGFPLIEGVLAFGVALHDAAQRRQRALQVRDNIQSRIGQAVGDAMAEIDVSRVRGHIADRIDGIVLHQVDSVIAQMGLQNATQAHRDNVATLPTIEPQKPVEAHTEPQNATSDTVESHHSEGFGPQNLQQANEAKQQQVEERRSTILQLCRMVGEVSVGELQERLQDDFGIEASESTLRSDLASLCEVGNLVKSGRGRWDVAHGIAEKLPSVAEPVLNGVGH